MKNNYKPYQILIAKDDCYGIFEKGEHVMVEDVLESGVLLEKLSTFKHYSEIERRFSVRSLKN